MKSNPTTNLWDGQKCLDNELPWLTPEAITKLDILLTPSMKVLEFGSGGSTLFFSRRTSSVLSFESSPDWYFKVRHEINKKSLNNITLDTYTTVSELLGKLPNTLFNCILIDSSRSNYMIREKVLQNVTHLLASPRILILDNYDASFLFPNTRLLSDSEFAIAYNLESCTVQEFNHPNWVGKGTKLYYE